MRGFISFLFLFAMALLLSTTLSKPVSPSLSSTIALLRHDHAQKNQLLLNTNYYLNQQFHTRLSEGIREPVLLQELLWQDQLFFWQQNGVDVPVIPLLSPWKVIVVQEGPKLFFAKAYYVPFVSESYPLTDSTASISLPWGFALSYP